MFLELSESEIAALLLSIKVSFLAVGLGIVPAVLAARLLAIPKFKGKALLDGIFHLPLVVPPVVTGYILLTVFSRRAPMGAFLEKIGFDLAFNWKGAALASMVMVFPLMVRSIRLSMESIDSGLAKAAKTLGAGRMRIFTSITLPLAVPGIISGAVIGFARSLGEFGATITFVSNIPGETQTLPLALYNFTQTPGAETQGLRLCIISVIVALLALVASEYAARKASRRLKR